MPTESRWELRATIRTIPDQLERTAPGHDTGTGTGRIRPDYEVDGAHLLTLAADGVAGTYSTSLLDRRLKDLFTARVDDIPAGLPLEQRNTWAAAAERAADAVAAYDPAPARRAIEVLAARHATPEACREIAEVRITYPKLNHEVLGTSTRKLIGLYGVDHIGTSASTVIAPRSVIELFNLPSTARGEQRQRRGQRPDSDSRRVDRHSRIERTSDATSGPHVRGAARI